MIELRRGMLSTGKEWYLTLCAWPDANIIEGLHLILACVDHPTPSQLTQEERFELYLTAVRLAEEYASEPERWRVDINGPAVAIRSLFHIHIKLPAGNDVLGRLIG